MLEGQIQKHVESMTYEHVSGGAIFERGFVDASFAAWEAAGAVWAGAYHEDDPNSACRCEFQLAHCLA
jgi:hypothetical protein